MGRFAQQRLKWIGERLASHGYINRKDLVGQFGVSRPTASKDLNAFLRVTPDLMVYNPHKKRYEFNH